MSRPTANDITIGTILDANGERVVPTHILTSEEALILRKFDQLCRDRGLRVEFHCATCFNGDLHDGMKGNITPNEIELVCRHRILFFLGASY